MNVTQAPAGPASLRINITLTPADYADEVTSRLKKIGRERTIPGFRAGHAPMPTLRRMFGEAVTTDVINDKVYREVYKYLGDNKIDILGYPVPVEVKPFDPAAEEHEFAYEVATVPALPTPIDKNIHVPYYNIKVTDEMVNTEDASLRKRFGSQVTGEAVESDAIVKGALMQLNEDGTVNTNEGAVQVVNGIVYPALFKDPEQQKLFLGKKVGDKVVFNPWKTCNGNAVEMGSMLNMDRNIAADIHSDFEMAISEIVVIRPAELGEELYHNAFGKDVTNEEQYFAAIRGAIGGALKGNSEQVFNHDVQKAIVEAEKNIDLPEEVFKKIFAQQNSELSAEDAEKAFNQERPAIIWQIVSEVIAKEHNLDVTEDDLMDCAIVNARRQFAQYGMTNLGDDVYADYAKRMIEDKQTRPRLVEAVRDAKLFETVKGLVTLDEKEVTLDELREIVNKD